MGHNATLVIAAVGLISLAASALPSAASGLCYGEAMRCPQDQGWKKQTRQWDPAAPARQVTPNQPAQPLRQPHHRDRG